jgi:hypothetical protein
MNQRGDEHPSVLARALPGVAASIFASIPLAIAYSIYGIASSSEEFSVAYMLVGTVATVLYSLMVSAVASVVFGIPIYAVTVVCRAPRAATLIVAASIAGVLVLALFGGGVLADDIQIVVVFAVFGAFSGAAFWFGAERWSRSK